MSQGAVRAGAAYEAILHDKVTGKVNQIIESLGRLEAAFKQINPAANTLNQAMGGIGGAMNQAANASTRSVSRVAMLGQSFQKLSAITSAAGQAIGQSLIHIGNQMRMIGVAATGAAAGIGYFLYRATRAASAATETFNKFNQVFGDSAEGMDDWARRFSESIGRSQTQTREGLATFRSFFTGMGYGQQEANEMSKQMQRLAIDFASFNNIADEEALRRFLGGLAGQSENLMRFGINIQDAALAEHELARQLGLTTQEMTQQQKTAIRFAIISEKMKEMRAEGDALRTAFEFENQIKRLGAAFETLQRRIGEVIKEGIGRDILQALNAVIGRLSQLGADQVNSIVGLAATLGILGSAFTVLGTVLAMAGPPIIAAGAALASFFGLIGSLVAAGPVGLLIGAFGVLGTAIAGLVGYFMLRDFPIIEAFNTLSGSMSRIAETAQQALGSIANFVAAGDWDRVWEVVVVAGELAFRELADSIVKILSLAITNAVLQGFKAAADLLPGGGGLTGGIFTRGPVQMMLDAVEANQKEMENLRVRLEQLSDEAQKAAEAAAAGRGEEGIGEDKGGPPEMPGGRQGGRRLRTQMESVGAAGAMLARSVANFAPAMDAQFEKLEKNQEKQLTAAEEANRELSDQTALLRDISESEFVMT